LTAFGAGPYGVNPLDPTDPAVLEMGQVHYLRHCYVCHGAQGEGNGPVVQPGAKFPLGPPVTSPTAAAYSDGYLYAIIRAGRNLMPAYGGRTTHEDRWAIVAYIRQLQASGGQAPAAGAPAGVQPPAADTTGAQTPPAGDTANAGSGGSE
jgi:mono/diheme cytochrome c family protein